MQQQSAALQHPMAFLGGVVRVKGVRGACHLCADATQQPAWVRDHDLIMCIAYSSCFQYIVGKYVASVSL